MHVDAHTQQEGEEQLVLLEERAAHVAVQAVGEVVVDVEDTLRDVVRPFGVGDAAEEDADEPLEGVLVHGVDGGHVGHAEEEDLGVDGHRDVLTAGHVNVFLCLLCHQHFGLRINQHTRGLSSARKTSHKHNKQDLSHPW